MSVVTSKRIVSLVAVPIACVDPASSGHVYFGVLPLPRYLGNNVCMS